MKKTTFAAGIVSLVGLVFSISNIHTIFAFYVYITPASSILGQEVWAIIGLFAFHFFVLTVITIVVAYKSVVRWNKIK
jgi:hypothetical protein